jgi:uncharacterized membrane protein YhiD involved in acid resistance
MADNKQTVYRGGGIGFCGLLTIVLIAFKLLGILTCSWLWVLSPLWIPFALALIVAAVVVVIWLLATVLFGAWVRSLFRKEARR